MNICVKVNVLARSGKLLRICRERSALSLVKQGRAELLPSGDVRISTWTDEEIDEMNQLALIQRESIPTSLRGLYANWEEIFREIDDGRRWRGQQSASRPTPGAGYNAISVRPSVMVFT